MANLRKLSTQAAAIDRLGSSVHELAAAHARMADSYERSLALLEQLLRVVLKREGIDLDELRKEGAL